MRRLLGIAAVMAAVLASASCGSDSGNSGGGGSQGEKVRIGFSQANNGDVWRINQTKNVENTCKSLIPNSEVIVTDGGGKGDKQSADVDDLVTKKVKVLLLTPLTADALTPAAERAMKASIPVITLDRAVTSDVTQHIGADNKLIGLATMSHEIRTPMNGMLVMAELLSAAPLPDRHRRYAEVIRSSGMGLLSIINDILDISKIEAGKLELEEGEVAPDALINGVLCLFVERAGQKQLELSGRIAADVPALLRGDATRLSQVVTNLVNNALKFSDKGGVCVEASRIDGARPGHCRLRVEVADSGVGIAPDKLGLVFERFSQADQSITRQFGGSGLGLSICKRLIDAMDGTIAVDSTPGSSSRFWFEVELAVLEEAPAVASGLTEARILLAISGDRTAGHLAASFREHGFSIVRFDGVAPPNSGPFDAIVGDPAIIETIGGKFVGTPIVGLARLGESRTEDMLRAHLICDTLSLPATRAEIADISARIRIGQFPKPHDAPLAGRRMPGFPEFAGAHVLAVDDNAVNREVLRDALSALGVTVTLANSGTEAIDLAASRSFDIVFMDCSMPQMDGFTATSRIRAAERQTGRPVTPVVALTAHIGGNEAARWRDAGMNGYLTKPFTIEALAKAISVHTARRAKFPTPHVEARTPPIQAAPTGAAGLIHRDTLDLLASLTEKTGVDMTRKTFRLFLDNAFMAREELGACVKKKDAMAIRQAAHAFKSMCLSAGARPLAAILQDIEDSAKIGVAPMESFIENKLDPILAATTNEMQGLACGEGARLRETSQSA